MEKFIIVSKKTFDIYCEAHGLEGDRNREYFEMRDKEGKIRAFYEHGFLCNKYKILTEVPDDFVPEEPNLDLFPIKKFFTDKEL